MPIRPDTERRGQAEAGNAAAQRPRKAWPVVGVVIVFAAGVCWFLFASPPLNRMFRELQACPANEITEVRIYDFDSLYAGSSPTLVMRDNEAAGFMRLISKAKKAYPNHPRGGPTLFAEVDTARWGTRHLRINATENCGVLIYMTSKKVGDGGRWVSAPFRNDDLISIFSDYAQARRARGSG